MIIDRRDALAGMAAMFGASLFAPIARAAAMQVTPISAGPPSSPVFTPPQRALMTALSEREIGRAHVCNPVTNAHLVCRRMLQKTKYYLNLPRYITNINNNTLHYTKYTLSYYHTQTPT